MKNLSFYLYRDVKEIITNKIGFVENYDNNKSQLLVNFDNDRRWVYKSDILVVEDTIDELDEEKIMFECGIDISETQSTQIVCESPYCENISDYEVLLGNHLTYICHDCLKELKDKLDKFLDKDSWIKDGLIELEMSDSYFNKKRKKVKVIRETELYYFMKNGDQVYKRSGLQKGHRDKYHVYFGKLNSDK